MDHVSLIYKLLVLQMLIGEANSVIQRMDLQNVRISGPGELTSFSVFPPGNDPSGEVRSFDAALATADFTFGMNCSGKGSLGFARLHAGPQGGPAVEDWHDGDGAQGVRRGSVSSHRGYELAREWLQKLGMDVNSMEGRYQHRVEHAQLPLTTLGTVSSRFRVTWGGGDQRRGGAVPVVAVSLNEGQRWLVRVDVESLEFYRNPLPTVPHAAAVNLLPDAPVQRLFSQNNWSPQSTDYTNAFALLATTPSYEAKMRTQLLDQTKRIFSVLDCDQLDEPVPENLTDFYVNPPAFGPGGRLEFKNGEVQFDENGRLRLFYFLPRGQTNYYLWLYQKQQVISTNEACELAIAKLKALSFDIEALDHEFSRTVEQGRFYRIRKSDHKKLWFDTCEFSVEWRSKSNRFMPPVVRVVVYGDLKKIGKIELADTSYCKMSPIQPPGP